MICNPCWELCWETKKPLWFTNHKSLILLARPAGIEPTTKNLEGSCSIQLSYGRTGAGAKRQPCGAQYSDSAPCRQALRRMGQMPPPKTAHRSRSQGSSWANFTTVPTSPAHQFPFINGTFTEVRYRTVPKPAVSHHHASHHTTSANAQTNSLAHRQTRWQTVCAQAPRKNSLTHHPAHLLGAYGESSAADMWAALR